MKNMFVKISLCALALVFTTGILKATVPNWSVSGNQFQYSMTVTAVLNVDCNVLGNDTNMIGAFVNGVCRGVANTNTLVGGQNLAYLVVYSNLSSGETVQFKYYSVQGDSVGTANVTLVFTNNAQSGTNNAPFVIKNNDPPTSIALSVTSIPESDTVGQVVSMLSCADPNVGDTHTYTLVSGTGSNDNAKVLINGTSLVLNSLLNFYLQDSLQIRIRSTDNRGCHYEQAMIVHITHVNHAPNSIHISDSTAWDQLPVHTPTGILSSTDFDHNETYTYSLVAGIGDTNNVAFSIGGDTLYAALMFDYQVKTHYTIRLRTTNAQGLFFERAMIIRIADTPEPPTDMALSSNRIYENMPAGSFVAVMSSTDDISRWFTYSFNNTGTNDNHSFTISNDTLKSSIVFNFNVKNLYTILLTTTDSMGLSFTKSFPIEIRDTLVAPTDLMLNNAFIVENQPVHTLVGVFATADINGPNTPHTYTLVNGSGNINNSSFTISNDSLFSNAVFQFEARDTFFIRVQTTLANNLSLQKAFVINVLAGNDTIHNILLSNDSIYGNNPPTQVIGQLSTVTQDTSDRFVYTFDNSLPSDNAHFTLTTAGLLSAGQVFNFHVKPTYLISVQTSTPSGPVMVKQFTIKIRDTLDLPTNINLSDSLMQNDRPAHTYIGSLSTVDDNGPACKHTYTLVSGTGSADDTSFVIGHDSIFCKSIVDFEAKSIYHIRIRTTLINGMEIEKPFIVFATDTGNIPLAHGDSIAVPENAPPKYLMTPTVGDSDRFAVLRYMLQNTDGPFEMDPVTGKLSLIGPLSFNTQNRYVLPYLVYQTGIPSIPSKRDSANIIVTVLPVQEKILPVNNYVSPNGDGKNDRWVIQSVDVYADYQLTIYNTNGVVVFQTSSYDNTWDGSGLDAGVYYYTFFGTNKYKGSITLVK